MQPAFAVVLLQWVWVALADVSSCGEWCHLGRLAFCACVLVSTGFAAAGGAAGMRNGCTAARLPVLCDISHSIDSWGVRVWMIESRLLVRHQPAAFCIGVCERVAGQLA